MRIKRKIPKSVNVCGHVYKVQISKKLDADVAGLTTFPTRLIEFSAELEGELRWLTFLHELKHAFDFENGDSQLMHEQTAEKSCEQFASFISSLQKQGVL